jgi:hypothetical protein
MSAQPKPTSVPDIEFIGTSSIPAVTKTTAKKRTSSYSATSAVKKVAKKNQPHVLIWVCHHGPGARKSWNTKNLKIVGVYSSKEAAEAKKVEVMSRYDNCGNGDIMVGGTWDDEIDLIVRAADECVLD